MLSPTPLMRICEHIFVAEDDAPALPSVHGKTGILPLGHKQPHESLACLLFFRVYIFFLIKLVELIVDSHGVVRNNMERSHVPFTRLPPVIISHKATLKYHNIKPGYCHRYRKDSTPIITRIPRVADFIATPTITLPPPTTTKLVSLFL